MWFLGTLVLGRLLNYACNVMLPLSSQSLDAVRHEPAFSVATEHQQILTMLLTCTVEQGKQHKYVLCPGRMQAGNIMTSTVTANMR